MLQQASGYSSFTIKSRQYFWPTNIVTFTDENETAPFTAALTSQDIQ